MTYDVKLDRIVKHTIILFVSMLSFSFFELPISHMRCAKEFPFTFAYIKRDVFTTGITNTFNTCTIIVPSSRRQKL